MSDFEEVKSPVQWVGPQSNKSNLSVVVLSQTVEIIDKISEALSHTHRNGDYKWKLLVLRAFCLEDLERQTSLTGRLAIDFVVIAMDTSRLCLNWTKSVLLEVHPDLRSRRVILVNAGGLPAYAMAESVDDLLDLGSSFNVDIITGDVNNDRGALSLARRLLKYIEVTFGVHTGIPNLNA